MILTATSTRRRGGGRPNVPGTGGATNWSIALPVPWKSWSRARRRPAIAVALRRGYQAWLSIGVPSHASMVTPSGIVTGRVRLPGTKFR